MGIMGNAKRSGENNLHHVMPSWREEVTSQTDAPGTAQPGSLAHALQTAEQNEQALVKRLHRVHDPKGMQLLRELRQRIASLKERLGTE